MIERIKTIGRVVWKAFDDHVWLPLAIVAVLLMIVNFPS